MGCSAQHGSAGRHDQCGRHALVGDVADDHAEPTIVESDEVVEVATNRPCRPVKGVDLPAGDRGQLLREEGLLDEGRDLEFLMDAFPLLRLDLLLADELGNLHRRRHLGGEAAEKPPIVGRIRLVGEPGAEVEGTEELALADQRHDELDTGFPEDVHGVRLQFEVTQHNGPTRRKEKSLQRIPNRDRDGFDQPGLRLRDRRFVAHWRFFVGSAPSHQLNHGPISISRPSRNRYEPIPKSMSGASSRTPLPSSPRPPCPGRGPGARSRRIDPSPVARRSAIG